MTSPILSELLQQTTALRALACELVGDARADDIVQETAIQTMTAPPKRSGPAGGWLATVVRNVASKHRRAERVRQLHEAKAARADVAPPDRSAEDADTLRRLTDIVTSLPEPYRGTILARYLREQTPSEIAAATSTPVRTVKTRLQRGLAMLRQRLDEQGIGERGRDWRALFVGVFQLEPTVAYTGPTLLGTTMKLSVSAVVFLSVGVVIWHYLPDSVRAPTDSGIASGHVAMEASVANPEAAIRRNASASRTTDTSDPVAAAAPSAVRTPDHETVVSKPKAAEPPADRPLMRLDIAGPAAFRAAFQRTNAGELLASEAGERLWRPLMAPVERIWRQWDGGGDKFDATRNRVLDYAGHIRVLWIAQPGQKEQRDRVFGIIAMDADGSTDLSALGGDLSRSMQAILPNDPTEKKVGEHSLRLLGDGGSEIVTTPVLVDGCLVSFFGEAAALDQAVPRCLKALAKAVERPPAPVSLFLDLAQLKGLSDMRDEPAMAKVLGLESLRSLHASLRPNGRQVQVELEVVFGEGDRGAIAGLLPAVATLPQLLARVPAEATPWLTVPFRPDVMFRAGLEAVAATDSDEGGVEALRKKLHDELGLYLDTELLDHLGGEIMVLGDLWQSGDRQVIRRGDDPPFGACVAMNVKDPAAFHEGFGKLLQHLKGIVHRYETREVEGVKITRMGSVFVTGVHVAMGQDLFAVAFGKEGVAQLEALVVGGQKGAARPLPAAVQRVQQLAPAGLNGVGLANLSALFGGQATIAIEALNEALPRQMDFSFDATQEWFDKMLPLVVKHKLDDLVTMTGYDDKRWRLRVLW